MYRKTGYIIARIFGLLAVLLMTAFVAIQMPYVQTRLSKVALNQLAAIMDGRIQYDELKVMTSGVILIRNLTLVDEFPATDVDTVARIKTVTATFALDGLFKGEGLHLGRVTIEDGLFHLVSEPDPPGNNLSRIFRVQPQEQKPQEQTGSLFDIKKVKISNFRFMLTSLIGNAQDSAPQSKGPHVDFQDLDITASITAHNLRMSDGRITGVLDKLSAREKSGYTLKDMSASVEVSPGKVLVEDVRILDPWTDLRMRSFSLSYASGEAFANFLEEVRLDADIQRSQVGLQTVAFFSGGLFNGSPTVFDLRRGNFSGYVSDFRVSRFVFTERNTGVSGQIEGRMNGIPEVDEMALNAQVTDLKGTAENFTRLLHDMFGTRIELGKIGYGIPLTLQVRLSGLLASLGVEADVTSPEGNFKLDGRLDHITDPNRPLDATVQASLQELDLGRLLGTDVLGTATLRTRLRATLGSGLPDATLDTLHIERIRALGRDFQQITAVGSLENGTAQAHLHSDDPAARFDINALLDLEERAEGSRYRVNGTLSDVDLDALGFNLGGRVSRLSTALGANLVRRGEFLDGRAALRDLVLQNADGRHQLGDIRINAETKDGEQQIRLDAPFLEAHYAGTRQVTGFIEDLQEVTVRRELPSLFLNESVPDGTGRYSLEATFRDSRGLLAVLVPGAYVEQNSALSLNLSEQGALSGSLRSGRIASGKNYLKDVDLSLNNAKDALSVRVSTSEMRANAFAVNNPSIRFTADEDRLLASLLFDSFTGAGGEGEINLDGEISRSEDGELLLHARPQNSFLTTDSDTWYLTASDIFLKGKDLRLDRLLLGNGPQQLLVDGGLGSSRSDTLRLQMNRFDLALIDGFLPKAFGIEGRMNGDAQLRSGGESEFGMELDFRVDTLRLGGVDAGDLRLSSRWHGEDESLGLLLLDQLNGREALRAAGSYFVNDKKLNLQADLDRLPLEVASPFLTGVFSEMGGGISGRIALNGPTDGLTPSSEDLRLEDARIRLAITGVAYTANGPLRLDGKGLYIDKLQVRDDTDGSGSIQGALRFNNLQNFTLDSRVNFNNLKVVDSPERPENAFYGLLRATGTASVTGPFSNLLVDANVSTSGNGNIHVPLSNGLLAKSQSDLLTFTEPTRQLDAYEEMLAGMEAKTQESSDLRIHGRLTINPGTQAFIEIDKAAGNVASFNGQGTVNLNLRPSKAVFELNGDYNINEGNYQFVIPGLLSKGFSIQRGSSVKFGGDIMNTELNITANYELRTALDALVGMETSSRRQVLCGINITDRLRAPQLDLSIDIPDLDPVMRTGVESALNTTDKIQKQFVALLLFGSFIADDSSGVSNRGSNLLFSNVVEMLSGQVNNVLQRLQIPVDVGFGYQQSSYGNNLFDVSLSTQLFHDRVIVGGNFGNRRYSTGTAGGDFMGNLDLQVKLDPEGKFRFTVFSHSADEFTNFLDYSQRNGVGVSYQREYYDFNDFLRKLFVPKAKRTEIEQQALEKRMEQTVIEIEHEPGQTLPDPDAPRRKRSRRGPAEERP
ncbi:MAG: translocation/assembly module TamB domain-containing protein [Bacteroidales bacterium]|nr:translocation/assembly module TamB domain-containing protein [Bacteroidales bacterium]